MNNPQPQAHPMTYPPDQAHLLGTISDAALAKLLGLPKHVVKKARMKSGRPSLVGNDARAFKPTEEQVQLLGRLPDAALARKWGVSNNAVAKQRERMGIPACPDQPKPPPAKAKIVFPDEAVALMGVVADAEIARRFSIDASTVWHRRKTLGLPTFQPARRPAPEKATKWGKLARVTDEELVSLSLDEIIELIGQPVSRSGVHKALQARGLTRPKVARVHVDSVSVARPSASIHARKIEVVRVRKEEKPVPPPPAVDEPLDDRVVRPEIVALPVVVTLEPPEDDDQIPTWVDHHRRRGTPFARVMRALGWTSDELREMWR